MLGLADRPRSVAQEIRFCPASDGVRLAWARHGSGPPIVKASNWLTHLEHDWDSPVWGHWLRALGERHTLIRYDERGCGLSDRAVGDVSFDRWVGDLEAVADAAGAERFTLLGVSQGVATAVAYAARHPERVERLVLFGGFARGRSQRDAQQRDRVEALIGVIRTGWTDPDPGLRHLFSTFFLPSGSVEQIAWHEEGERLPASAETAERLYRARSDVNVTGLAPRVTAPALVAHAREDAVVPFEEGRLLASLLPRARLLPLQSPSHLPRADEPAWKRFVDEVGAFVGAPQPAPAPAPADLSELSNREHDVLALVALGLENEAIAARLFISARTVERHLSNIYVKLSVSGKAARAAAAARFARASLPADSLTA